MALSGNTEIISSPLDDERGSNSGYIYVFIIRGKGTWEEVKKLITEDGEAGDCFGLSVAIYGNNAVIGDNGFDERGCASRYGSVYNKIGGKWIENVKIVSEDGAAN